MKSIQLHYHRSKICLHLHLFSQIFWEGSHQGKNHGSTPLTPLTTMKYSFHTWDIVLEVIQLINFRGPKQLFCCTVALFLQIGNRHQVTRKTLERSWFKGFPLSACAKPVLLWRHLLQGLSSGALCGRVLFGLWGCHLLQVHVC